MKLDGDSPSLVFTPRSVLHWQGNTHKEAGYVAEILTLVGLQAGKNVLVDGSLRDHEWYQKYFAFLRKEYPMYKLAIIHVVAPRDAVFERAAERAT